MADEFGSPSPAQPVYNQATRQLEVPSSTVTAMPHSVSGTSRKIIDPNAVEAQGELEQARQEQLAAEAQTIPIDKLPDELLSPDELAQRWEGGINQPPETKVTGVSYGPRGFIPQTEQQAPKPSELTRAELQDRVNAYKATQQQAMEAKLQRENAEKQAAYEQQLQQQMAAFSAAKAEAARAASPEVLFAKPSFAHRIMNGIAAALGAYGATLGHTENYALKIINARQEEDMQLKRMALDGAIKKAERAGASVEQLMQMRQQGLKLIGEKRIEQNHWIDAQVAKMQSLWPAEAQKLAVLRAGKQAENAKDTRDFLAAYGGEVRTGTNYSTAVTVTEGSTARQPTPSVSDAEAKKATYGKQIVDATGVIEGSRRLTDDEIKQFNQNIMSMRADAENATKGLFGPAKIKAMRALGISPDSMTEGLDPEAKKIANAMSIASGLVVRDQSGAAITNFEDLNNAMQRLPQVGDTDEIYAGKVKGLREYGRNLVKLAGPEAQRRLGVTPEGKEAKAESKAGAKAPRTPQEAMRRLSADDRAALKWADDNQKDPRAKAIRQRIQKKLLGGE